MNAEYVEDGYGQHLNHVPSCAVRCPRGHIGESLDVYEDVAVWACGEVRNLPPVRPARYSATRALT